MFAQDECGWPLLVEGLLNVEQGSCGRNQLRSEGGQQVKKESVLSIAQAARRSGSALVVLGPENLRILCEVCPQKPSDLRWYANNVEMPASRISFLLEQAQGAGQ
jgi:hypothetical protein